MAPRSKKGAKRIKARYFSCSDQHLDKMVGRTTAMATVGVADTRERKTSQMETAKTERLKKARRAIAIAPCHTRHFASVCARSYSVYLRDVNMCIQHAPAAMNARDVYTARGDYLHMHNHGKIAVVGRGLSCRRRAASGRRADPEHVCGAVKAPPTPGTRGRVHSNKRFPRWLWSKTGGIHALTRGVK